MLPELGESTLACGTGPERRSIGIRPLVSSKFSLATTSLMLVQIGHEVQWCKLVTHLLSRHGGSQRNHQIWGSGAGVDLLCCKRTGIVIQVTQKIRKLNVYFKRKISCAYYTSRGKSGYPEN